MLASKKPIRTITCLYWNLFAINSKFVIQGFDHFMIMYGYQPKSPMTVGLATKTVEKEQEFIQENFDILRIARQKVKQAQGRYKKYANEHKTTCFFQGGRKNLPQSPRVFTESEDWASD